MPLNETGEREQVTDLSGENPFLRAFPRYAGYGRVNLGRLSRASIPSSQDDGIIFIYFIH